MKTINVFIYAYKNKNIKNIVNLLEEKSSKNNNLIFDIYDQDNEDKTLTYKKDKNIHYHHIFWDHVYGISYYRQKSLLNDFDYFFQVGNLIEIKNNWDIKLINLAEYNVVSNNKITNADMIFLNKKNSKILTQMKNLKFYGQDIYFYYLLFKNNIEVFDIGNKFCIFDTNKLLTSDYIPYSLYNDYNDCLKIILNDVDFKNYCIKNNINLSYRLKQYSINDLEYDENLYNIDHKKSEKFHNFIKSIKRSDG